MLDCEEFSNLKTDSEIKELHIEEIWDSEMGCDLSWLVKLKSAKMQDLCKLWNKFRHWKPKEDQTRSLSEMFEKTVLQNPQSASQRGRMIFRKFIQFRHFIESYIDWFFHPIDYLFLFIMENPEGFRSINLKPIQKKERKNNKSSLPAIGC